MAIGRYNYYTRGRIGLMFIEPKAKKTAPIYDELSQRVSRLVNKFVEAGPRSKGVHTCACGVHSDNANYVFPDKYKFTHVTNSLMLHYVVFHRDEIPNDEMSELLFVLGIAGV